MPGKLTQALILFTSCWGQCLGYTCTAFCGKWLALIKGQGSLVLGTRRHFNCFSFSLLAEEPSEATQAPSGKTPLQSTRPSEEAPTEPPRLTPPPEDAARPPQTGQKPVLPQRPLQPPPLPAWPGRQGLPFLPGSSGVIMETGEAGPPGRMGVSGRGLPQGVDGQMGQGPIPSSEGYAGAPGKPSCKRHRRADPSSLCLSVDVCVVGSKFHL